VAGARVCDDEPDQLIVERRAIPSPGFSLGPPAQETLAVRLPVVGPQVLRGLLAGRKKCEETASQRSHAPHSDPRAPIGAVPGRWAFGVCFAPGPRWPRVGTNWLPRTGRLRCGDWCRCGGGGRESCGAACRGRNSTGSRDQSVAWISRWCVGTPRRWLLRRLKFLRSCRKNDLPAKSATLLRALDKKKNKKILAVALYCFRGPFLTMVSSGRRNGGDFHDQDSPGQGISVHEFAKPPAGDMNGRICCRSGGSFTAACPLRKDSHACARRFRCGSRPARTGITPCGPGDQWRRRTSPRSRAERHNRNPSDVRRAVTWIGHTNLPGGPGEGAVGNSPGTAGGPNRMRRGSRPKLSCCAVKAGIDRPRGPAR